MTEDAIKCPRCQGRTRSSSKTLKVTGADLDIIKYTCIDCDTGFYFEEQIVTFLVLKSVKQ